MHADDYVFAVERKLSEQTWRFCADERDVMRAIRPRDSLRSALNLAVGIYALLGAGLFSGVYFLFPAAGIPIAAIFALALVSALILGFITLFRRRKPILLTDAHANDVLLEIRQQSRFPLARARWTVHNTAGEPIAAISCMPLANGFFTSWQIVDLPTGERFSLRERSFKRAILRRCAALVRMLLWVRLLIRHLLRRGRSSTPIDQWSRCELLFVRATGGDPVASLRDDVEADGWRWLQFDSSISGLPRDAMIAATILATADNDP